VQSRLGHATAAETLDTYSHLWPDSDDRTRQAIDELLGGSTADNPRGDVASRSADQVRTDDGPKGANRPLTCTEEEEGDEPVCKPGSVHPPP
jgi:hypothetical protein